MKSLIAFLFAAKHDDHTLCRHCFKNKRCDLIERLVEAVCGEESDADLRYQAEQVGSALELRVEDLGRRVTARGEGDRVRRVKEIRVIGDQRRADRPRQLQLVIEPDARLTDLDLGVRIERERVLNYRAIEFGPVGRPEIEQPESLALLPDLRV